ncbi:MAG: TonB C-terminal domain-containing protein [Ideonella sp.]|nr:TonB C-terminal domain-containing protein [Ideonella sp.]
MNAAALVLPREAFAPREPEGRARGIGLSVLVHAGLVVAIAFGVSWRSHTPEAYEAELWAAVPQAAAPRAVEPEPVPVAPPPRPAPVVVAPPPPKSAEVPDAKIAIEKARQEQLRKQQQEAAERERRRAAEAEQRQAAEKRRQQEAEKQLKKQQQAADERAAQQREAERQRNLQRIQGLAGASGDASARGTALQSAGPSASYAGMIVARLKRENNFIGAVAGNPKAEVEIRVSLDGTIVGRRLLRSSGVAAWDEAVLRAIDKAGALPRDTDGRVQNPTLVVWGPQD